jgi:ribonuclease P protein component
MPKKYRLTGDEMKTLSGKRFHGRFFSLLIARAATDHPKFAVVVSKKVSLKAVERNKVKRRMRNALTKLRSHVQKPAALVLSAKADAKKASYAELVRDIESLFSKL